MTRAPLLGCAVDADALRDDASYRDLVTSLFSSITPENALKFGPLRPARDTFDFEAADRIVRFGEAAGMMVRGHTLIWHSQLSDWVSSARPVERAEIMREHISTVVSRYRGRIAQWDVVNEPLDDDGSPRESPWLEGAGIDYIANAFRLAHQADPDARLFINDYNVEDIGQKSDAYLALITDLLADGVPIHGFGVQGHRIVGDPPTSMRKNLKRFADLGLEVALTEVDIRVPVPAQSRDLEAQAADYRGMFDDALSTPACSAFVLWGLSDRHSWIPDTFPGFGAAHVLDGSLRPKPAFDAVFRTDSSLATEPA